MTSMPFGTFFFLRFFTLWGPPILNDGIGPMTRLTKSAGYLRMILEAMSEMPWRANSTETGYL